MPLAGTLSRCRSSVVAYAGPRPVVGAGSTSSTRNRADRPVTRCEAVSAPPAPAPTTTTQQSPSPPRICASSLSELNQVTYISKAASRSRASTRAVSAGMLGYRGGSGNLLHGRDGRGVICGCRHRGRRSGSHRGKRMRRGSMVAGGLAARRLCVLAVLAPLSVAATVGLVRPDGSPLQQAALATPPAAADTITVPQLPDGVQAPASVTHQPRHDDRPGRGGRRPCASPPTRSRHGR